MRLPSRLWYDLVRAVSSSRRRLRRRIYIRSQKQYPRMESLLANMIFVTVTIIGLLAVIFLLLKQLNFERAERNRVAERHQALALTVRYSQLSTELPQMNEFNADYLRQMEEEMNTLTSVHDVEGA